VTTPDDLDIAFAHDNLEEWVLVELPSGRQLLGRMAKGTFHHCASH
jgi:hypothetical protein